ncbi:MAG: hypothetical protein HYV26_09450 [Candidatus Hydrogenedentes bacterium]|nr:hypothetical protein [Candidatus Hydrogenedentota bacterium]
MADGIDRLLRAAAEIVVTSDSAILNRAQRWANLAPQVAADAVLELYVVDLGGD